LETDDTKSTSKHSWAKKKKTPQKQKKKGHIETTGHAELNTK
jgi:hypothetical protein